MWDKSYSEKEKTAIIFMELVKVKAVKPTIHREKTGRYM